MIDSKVVGAVGRRDVEEVRSAFTNMLLGYRGQSEDDVRDTWNYLKRTNLEGLFQPFDGEAWASNENWDTRYWYMIHASLSDNFCEERLEKLLEVGRKVYPAKAENPSVRRAVTVGSTARATGGYTRARRGSRVPVALAAAGAAVAVAGCLTLGVAKTAVAAAVIAGGVIFLKSRR